MAPLVTPAPQQGACLHSAVSIICVHLPASLKQTVVLACGPAARRSAIQYGSPSSSLPAQQATASLEQLQTLACVITVSE